MTNDDPAEPRYRSPLRSRQKEQTRDLILDSVDAMLRRAPVSGVTIAAVARQADITERTIYRHFPTREDLLEAVWRRALHAVSGRQPRQVETLDEILDVTRAAYQSFEADAGIVRALIAAPEGVDASRQPEEARLAMLREAYANLLAGVPEDEVNAVVMATHLLSGASAWSHLRDYCGLDGAEGGKAAALAIELLIAGAKARANAPRGWPQQAKKPRDLRGWISHRLLDQ